MVYVDAIKRRLEIRRVEKKLLANAREQMDATDAYRRLISGLRAEAGKLQALLEGLKNG
jgi:hypothetical protein